MHIKLETVCTSGRADIERRDRVLRPQGAPASVREYLRAIAEERHNL
jgi:hypothetical protein